MTRLEKAAYLSQIIGAIAVVVSLIYVGRQINDNTIEVRAQSVQELIVFGQEIDSWVVTNPFQPIHYDVAESL
jgi:flagellar motor component MotA